jgi:hypothetical protein
MKELIEQGHRKIVDAVISQIFQGFHGRRSSGARNTGNNQNITHEGKILRL